MTSRSSKRIPRTAAIAVPLAAAIVLTGCSSGDDESPAAGEVTYPTVPFTTPGEGIGLGSEDQEIGSTFPEPVHVSEIEPIKSTELLAVGDGYGLEIGLNALDPVTGVATAVLPSTGGATPTPGPNATGRPLRGHACQERYWRVSTT